MRHDVLDGDVPVLQCAGNVSDVLGFPVLQNIEDVVAPRRSERVHVFRSERFFEFRVAGEPSGTGAPKKRLSENVGVWLIIGPQLRNFGECGRENLVQGVRGNASDKAACGKRLDNLEQRGSGWKGVNG